MRQAYSDLNLERANDERDLAPDCRIDFCGTSGLLISPGFAQDTAKPDPAGIVTGDKATVVDAGGNTFAPAAPTDKTSPDYARQKKDADDFQAQAAREPLAVKLADGGTPAGSD